MGRRCHISEVELARFGRQCFATKGRSRFMEIQSMVRGVAMCDTGTRDGVPELWLNVFG